MNLCRLVFRSVQRLAELPVGDLPNPLLLGTESSRPLTKRRAGHVAMVLGTEAQFHHYADELVAYVFGRLFHDGDGTTWSAQRGWLREHTRSFFSEYGRRPAVLWAAPVWSRAVNSLRAEGLRRADKTLAIDSFPLRLTGRQTILLRFSQTLREFPTQVIRDEIFYDDRPRAILRVPRQRLVFDSLGADAAYDEAIALGHEDEVRVLHRGYYTPNNDFHYFEGERAFLDLYSLTLAVLYRQPIVRRECMTNWRDGFDAVAQFIRVTFDPVAKRKVVILSAERAFDRFVREHEGLDDLICDLVARSRE